MKKRMLATLALLVCLPAAAAEDPGQDCTGCQKRTHDASGSLGGDSNCQATLWTVTDGFTENCGTQGVACASATCKYTWALKYKHSKIVASNPDDCSGTTTTWALRRVAPVGNPTALAVSTTAVTLEHKKWDDDCGKKEAFEYVMVSSITPIFPGWNEVTLKGDHGCYDCVDVDIPN